MKFFFAKISGRPHNSVQQVIFGLQATCWLSWY